MKLLIRFGIPILCLGAGILGHKLFSENTGRDRIDIVTTLKPVIEDSIYKTTSFQVDDRLCKRVQQVVTRMVSSKFRFDKPVQVSNIVVIGKTRLVDLNNIDYTNDSTITIKYGIFCPGCWGCRQPPCPPLPPECTPSISIRFDCRISEWVDLKKQALNEKFSSPTRTVFISEYKDFPTTKTYKIAKWEYHSNIKVYRKGKLYREYDLTDKLPILRDCQSYILDDKQLVIEVYTP